MKSLLCFAFTVLLTVAAARAQNTLPTSGNVGIGTTSPQSPLSVSGQTVIGDPYTGDASLHIAKSYGGFGRLTQIQPSGISQDALNLMASTDAGGTGAWWSWGVSGGKWTINPGTSFGTGFTIDGSGRVGIGTSSPTHQLQVGPYAYVTMDGGSAEYAVFGAKTASGGGTRMQLAADTIRFGNTFASPTIYLEGSSVGIGTTSPTRPLQVGPYAYMAMDGGSAEYAVFGANAASGGGTRMHLAADTIRFGNTFGSPSMYMAGGNIGIGTSSPTEKLAVNGKIRAKEVIVDTGWSDYVFADDYRLAPLSEVEAHIKEKKHLPGIPSAAEVEAHGVSIGEVQSKLLAKVEEVTLHLIRIEKENVAQSDQIKRLTEENAALQRELFALKRLR